MKVELSFVDGNCSGFRLIAESLEDSLQLGSIRNSNFWFEPFHYEGVTALHLDKGDYTTSVAFGNKDFKWVDKDVLDNEKESLLRVIEDK